MSSVGAVLPGSRGGPISSAARELKSPLMASLSRVQTAKTISSGYRQPKEPSVGTFDQNLLRQINDRFKLMKLRKGALTVGERNLQREWRKNSAWYNQHDISRINLQDPHVFYIPPPGDLVQCNKLETPLAQADANISDYKKLVKRNDPSMIRWICGVQPKEEAEWQYLKKKLSENATNAGGVDASKNQASSKPPTRRQHHRGNILAQPSKTNREDHDGILVLQQSFVCHKPCDGDDPQSMTTPPATAATDCTMATKATSTVVEPKLTKSQADRQSSGRHLNRKTSHWRSSSQPLVPISKPRFHLKYHSAQKVRKSSSPCMQPSTGGARQSEVGLLTPSTCCFITCRSLDLRSSPNGEATSGRGSGQRAVTAHRARSIIGRKLQETPKTPPATRRSSNAMNPSAASNWEPELVRQHPPAVRPDAPPPSRNQVRAARDLDRLSTASSIHELLQGLPKVDQNHHQHPLNNKMTVRIFKWLDNVENCGEVYYGGNEMGFGP